LSRYNFGVQKVSPKSVPSAAPEETGLRRFYYLTAGICGAAILIVEILGAKMLAPFFGTSHFVWTAQIAVTMVSLAVGYYAGGWLVDRTPRVGRLYACILVASCYLCLTVPLCPKISFWCLDFNLAVGAVLASLFLFFPPLSLLAMTGPFLIRIMTSSVSGVGGQVGRLSAISTAGSVLGTVLIGYCLIPFLPNSMTMYLTAMVLMVLASAHFLFWGRSRAGLAGLVACVFGGLAVGWYGVHQDAQSSLPGMEELERRNSNFGLMQVFQATNELKRIYRNDYLVQNGYDPGRKQSIHSFTYLLHGLTRAYTSNLNEVLCIGLGVGIVPMQLAREGVKVEVVEINPTVVPIAEKYFDLEPAKLTIHIQDGRHFLNRCKKQYDAVVLDAFLGDSSPSHLMTREAFAAIKRVLKPKGTLVINSFGDLEPGRDYYTASLSKTLKAVFPGVRIHSRGSGNIFFVASQRAVLEPWTGIDLESVHPDVSWQVQMSFRGLVETNPQQGRVLTDDYNPVDFYDAANREKMRRYLAADMHPQN
jgi:spermidine synthase